MLYQFPALCEHELLFLPSLESEETGKKHKIFELKHNIIIIRQNVDRQCRSRINRRSEYCAQIFTKLNSEWQKKTKESTPESCCQISLSPFRYNVLEILETQRSTKGKI